MTLESDKAVDGRALAEPTGWSANCASKSATRCAQGTVILTLASPGARSRRRRPRSDAKADAGGSARAAPPSGARQAAAGRAGARSQARGLLRRPRRPLGAPAGARARRRSHAVKRHRREGPHHQGRLEVGARAASGARRAREAAAPACRTFRLSTSPSSARSRRSRSRASRRSPARACTPPGSTSRMSPIPTRPTSPSWRRSASRSTTPPRPTRRRPIASRCCRLLMKASVATLKAFPTFNSALEPGQGRADSSPLLEHRRRRRHARRPRRRRRQGRRQEGRRRASRELGALSAKARDGKLGPNEMQGATFTISSLGGIGGTAFHADRQRAGSGDPRRRALEDGAGVGRQGVSSRA